jgi:hypothetical protein
VCVCVWIVRVLNAVWIVRAFFRHLLPGAVRILPGVRQLSSSALCRRQDSVSLTEQN